MTGSHHAMTRRPHILVEIGCIDATFGQRLDRESNREGARATAFQQRNRRLVRQPDPPGELRLVKAEFPAQRLYGEMSFHVA